MASERRKVKYHWGSTSEGCPSKRSRPREPGNVAPSSRPGRRCASRPRGASSPQRLKVRRGDDVARAPRSSVRRRTSSSSSSSSLSSGSGVGEAASPGFLIASPRRLFTSKGSPLHPAHSSLEEMASLRKEACSVKVDSKDSSCRSTNSEFATEAEGQSDAMEEPNKFQKRKKDRPQDQGSRMIYLKAIQGILGKSMPKKKGEAATTQGKASLGDCPNQEGPSRKVEGPSKKVEGPARSRDGPSRSGEGRSRSREELVKSVEEGPAAKVTVTVSQKEESHTKVSVEKEASALDRSSFSDRRVIIDSVKKSSEELLGDRRTVIDKPSPALEFFDNSDSHADIQKHTDREVVMEHPSSGSDWSDVDELATVRFSQEEPVPLKYSAVSESSSFPTDCVMYPPHLYSSPWCDYASYWTSSHKTPGYPLVGSSNHDSAQAGKSSQDLLSVHSSKSQSISKGLDIAQEGRFQNSHSLRFSRSTEEEEVKGKRTFQEETPLHHTREHTSSSLPRSHRELSLEEGFIDTHCHLDMLYSKLSFKGTFTKFRKIYSSSFPKEFQGCISDFCDPRTLTDGLWEELLKEDLVWGAFGCHPHFARYYNESQERKLLHATGAVDPLQLVQAMPAARVEYIAPWWVVWLHSVPHLGLRLQRVDSTFSPGDETYQESLLFLGVLAAIGLGLNLIFLTVYLVCTCCCRRDHTVQTKQQESCCVTWTAVVAGLLCCAAVGVGFYGNSETNDGMHQLIYSLDNANHTFSGMDELVSANTQRMKVDLEQHLARLSEIIAARGDYIQTLKFMQQMAGNVVSQLSGLPVWREVTTQLTKLSHQTAYVEYYRWLSYLLLFILDLVICLVTCLGLARRSKCLLASMLCCGILTLILSWASLAADAAAAVGTSDFCMAPDIYILNNTGSQINSEVTRYYLHCSQSLISPFQQSLTTFQRSLTTMQIQVGGLLQFAVPLFPTAEKDLLGIQLLLNNSEISLHQLTAMLDCRGLHKDYLDALTGICYDGIEGLLFLGLFSLLAALAFSTLTCAGPRAWKYFINRDRDYDDIDDDDPFNPQARRIAAHNPTRGQLHSFCSYSSGLGSQCSLQPPSQTISNAPVSEYMNQAILFGGNPRYENVPLIGRGSPPPTYSPSMRPTYMSVADEHLRHYEFPS